MLFVGELQALMVVTTQGCQKISYVIKWTVVLILNPTSNLCVMCNTIFYYVAKNLNNQIYQVKIVVSVSMCLNYSKI